MDSLFSSFVALLKTTAEEIFLIFNVLLIANLKRRRSADLYKLKSQNFLENPSNFLFTSLHNNYKLFNYTQNIFKYITILPRNIYGTPVITLSSLHISHATKALNNAILKKWLSQWIQRHKHLSNILLSVSCLVSKCLFLRHHSFPISN